MIKETSVSCLAGNLSDFDLEEPFVAAGRHERHRALGVPGPGVNVHCGNGNEKNQISASASFLFPDQPKSAY